MRKDFDRPDTAAWSCGKPVSDTFEGLYASGLLARLKRQNLALDRLRHALERELAQPASRCPQRRYEHSKA